MRYLYKADDDEVFAYAPGRRDFFRAGDDNLWAHESHDWLIAAKSGETLAHRTGDTYYAVDGQRLYRVTSDVPAGVESDAAPTADDSEATARPRRAPQRAARTRR